MYEAIKLLEEKSLLDDLFELGIISKKLKDYKYIYEKYLLKISHSRSKTQAVLDTSLESGISETKMFRIINLMQKSTPEKRRG